jgi:hypothetical protein
MAAGVADVGADLCVRPLRMIYWLLRINCA